MNVVFISLLLFGTAFGATHVNISIAQQTVTNPADVTYTDASAPAALKAGPLEKQRDDLSYSSGVHEGRSARLQSATTNSKSFAFADDSTQGASDFSSGTRAARIQLAADNNGGQMLDDTGSRSSFIGETIGGGYSGGVSSQQQRQSEQLRERIQLEKKNIEFDRYIQRHHSGPTVETVFETSSTSPQRVQQSPSSVSGSSSSSSASSMSVHPRTSQAQKFERQVALQPKPVIESSQESVASSDGHPEQRSFDQSSNYDKSSYDQSNYNYNGVQQSDVHTPQFPPSVDESQAGYGGFVRPGFYGPQQPSAYQPPVVTKTIQIAQPALKAKKFEVRHPAIQKEFYDIEERVLIKPAGTVVVELNHPVAKIPKGETILPLGHPHPAVASAYHNPNAQGSYSGGSSASSNRGGGSAYNTQYSPSPVYSQKPLRESTTLGSSITSTPTFDHNSRGAAVEANLKGQLSGEGLFVPAAETKRVQEQQAPQDAYYIATDSHGNQRQIVGKNLSPKVFSEAEFRYPAHVEAQNNVVPGTSSAPFNQHQTAFGVSNKERRTQLSASGQTESNYNGQLNAYSNNNKDNDQFQAEYIDSSLDDNTNGRESFKPARLRESPLVSSETRTKIIRHEHNIHLPPSQHNLYLGRLEQPSTAAVQQPEQKSAQLKSSRFGEEEAARVVEVKPYLRTHPGSVVVYAATPRKPSARYSDTDNRVQVDQQRGQLRADNQQLDKVQYSAPYSQMRYNPQQSARLTYGKLYAAENEELAAASLTYDRSAGDKANLRAEDSKEAEGLSEGSTAKNADGGTRQTVIHQQNTHIQIKIPNLPQQADKPTVSSSTVSPPSSQERSENYRLSSSSSSFAPSSSEGRSGEYRSSSSFSNFAPSSSEERSGEYRSSFSNFAPSSSEERSGRYRSSSSSSSFAPSSSEERSGEYRSSSSFSNFAPSANFAPSSNEEQSGKYRSSSSPSSSFSNFAPSTNEGRFGKYRTSSSSSSFSNTAPLSSEERSENYRSSSSFAPSPSVESSGKYRSASSFSSFAPSASNERSGKYRSESSFSSFAPSASEERSGKYRSSSSSFGSSADSELVDVSKNFRATQYNDAARFGNLEAEARQARPDCDEPVKPSARYETVQVSRNQQQQQQQQQQRRVQHPNSQQKFLRIVESPDAGAAAANAESSSAVQSTAGAKPSDIEVSPNSVAGHVATPGSRVISSNPAPADNSSHSESFHKRRIVVNHPFQTVREVVEHEPYTNYHQIQVNEPAPSALYQVPFVQTQ